MKHARIHDNKRVSRQQLKLLVNAEHPQWINALVNNAIYLFTGVKVHLCVVQTVLWEMLSYVPENFSDYCTVLYVNCMILLSNSTSHLEICILRIMRVFFIRYIYKIIWTLLIYEVGHTCTSTHTGLVMSLPVYAVSRVIGWCMIMISV